MTPSIPLAKVAFIARFIPLLWLSTAFSGSAFGERTDVAIEQPNVAIVLDRVGRYGRNPTQTDPLEFQYADQGRIDIEEGDLVTTDDGTSARWRRVEAVKPGEFADPALRGGYALIRIKRDEPGVQVIEATGHSMMRVNGQPRVGDIYRTGMVKLPVELKAGVNDILVHCVRGEFEFQLRPARGRAELNLDDPTIPDLLTDRTSHDEAAVVILNAHAERLRGGTIEASTAHAEPIRTKIPDILSLSTRKVPFALPDIDTQQGESSVDVMLRLLDADGEVLDHDTLSLRVREPHQSHRRTFRSGIDGSLQYYAVQPATGMMQDENGEEVEAPSPPGLVLSLHGASVEAISQARSYEPKSWTHIVAPTNRRPFGFDWEDWGRIDAMEVLEVAERELRPDPLRRYLTGHSMGGHGTWQIGVHYPDRFAAIGPSASWISFWSYTGAAEYDEDHPHEAMLKRAVSPSDTLALESNLARYAIYILHGDEDESVPVEQARIMRERLGRFHTNFSYYERPGAGHWWGSQCMDWPPMFEMFERERLTPSDQRDAIDFTTATPGISASADWITIHAPQVWLKPARVQVSRDRELRLFFGETTNIARLAIELVGLEEGEPVSVELDDTHFDDIDWPESGALYFERAESDGAWQVAAPFDPQQKGPHRAGLFKSAFDHHMVFVIGTQGTEEENTWAFHKARYDAETFWYRGNGAVDIVADVDFDASADPDRNVILYGHAGMNAAWTEVIDDDELHVERDRVRLGDRELTGATRSVLAIRPRRGSAHASVGIVAGTGLPGLRATERMPYFVSGVAYPDVFIYDADLWSVGIEAVRASGFFCTDWSVANGDIAWTE